MGTNEKSLTEDAATAPLPSTNPTQQDSHGGSLRRGAGAHLTIHSCDGAPCHPCHPWGRRSQGPSGTAEGKATTPRQPKGSNTVSQKATPRPWWRRGPISQPDCIWMSPSLKAAGHSWGLHSSTSTYNIWPNPETVPTPWACGPPHHPTTSGQTQVCKPYQRQGLSPYI